MIDRDARTEGLLSSAILLLSGLAALVAGATLSYERSRPYSARLLPVSAAAPRELVVYGTLSIILLLAALLLPVQLAPVTRRWPLAGLAAVLIPLAGAAAGLVLVALVLSAPGAAILAYAICAGRWQTEQLKAQEQAKRLSRGEHAPPPTTSK